MQKNSLQNWVNVLLVITLSTGILYFARSFFIPLVLAMLLAMLLIPLCSWLEQKGIARGFASFISVLCLLGVSAGIIWLLSLQLSNIGEDFTHVKQNISTQINHLQKFITDTFGLTISEQKKLLNKQSTQSAEQTIKAIPNVLVSFLGIVANIFLVLVYMFLMLYSRSHIKNFFLQLPHNTVNREKTKDVLSKTSGVVQRYLFGLFAMIMALWIMYGIGFSIVGVKHALFFAVLCGILEIVPFVGNLTGTTLTVLMVISQGGGGGMIIGVVATYLSVQFIQSYILAPLIVGAQVNINPLVTIIALILGELIWGIAGMVLAIPLTGIIKIICLHVEQLRPYAYLLGQDKPPKKRSFKRNSKE